MIILISILLAFLLLCFITYIDFQIWYKKQKASEYPYYRVRPYNYLQTMMQTIRFDENYQQELAMAQAELQKHHLLEMPQLLGNFGVKMKAGQIIKVENLDEMFTGGIN